MRVGNLSLFLILFGFFCNYAQIAGDANLEAGYSIYIQRGDEVSLKAHHRSVKQMIQAGQVKPSSELKQKVLQVDHYISVKDKLDKCLASSSEKLKLGLENNILGAMANHLFHKDLKSLKQTCLENINLLENQEDFTGLIDAMAVDEKYKLYSKTQDSLYENALEGAMGTFADIASYAYTGDPKKWVDHIKKQLAMKFCKPETFDQEHSPDIKNNQQQAELRVQMKCINVIDKVLAKEKKRELINLDQAAEYLNSVVNKMNGHAISYSQSHSMDDYNAYLASYQAALSQSPGTLLITDILRDDEKGIGPMLTSEGILESGSNISNEHNYISTKNDDHIAFLNKAVSEAKEKTLEGIDKMTRDYRQLAIDDLENEFLDQALKKVRTGIRKNDIEELVQYYPASAGELLSDSPNQVYFICEAILAAESTQRFRQKRDKVIKWGGLIVGGALLVTGVGAAAGAAIYGASATIAGVSLGTIGATSATIGTVAGLLEASYHTTSAFQEYNRFKHHEAALYSQNSHNIKEFEESYHRYKEARVQAAINLGFSAIDLGALKVIKNLKPAQIDEMTAELNQLSKSGHIANARLATFADETEARAYFLKKFKIDDDEFEFGRLADELVDLNPEEKIRFYNELSGLDGPKAYQTLFDDLYLNNTRFLTEDGSKLDLDKLGILVQRANDPELTRGLSQIRVSGAPIQKGSINEYFNLVDTGRTSQANILRNQIEKQIQVAEFNFNKLKKVEVANNQIDGTRKGVYELSLPNGEKTKVFLKKVVEGEFEEYAYRLSDKLGVSSTVPVVTRKIDGVKYVISPYMESSMMGVKALPDEVKIFDLLVGDNDIDVFNIYLEGTNLKRSHNVMTLATGSGESVARVDYGFAFNNYDINFTSSELQSIGSLMKANANSPIVQGMRELTPTKLKAMMPDFDSRQISEILKRRDELLALVN